MAFPFPPLTISSLLATTNTPCRDQNYATMPDRPFRPLVSPLSTRFRLRCLRFKTSNRQLFLTTITTDSSNNTWKTRTHLTSTTLP
ncbi:hypothetical protein BJ508DRAFT_181247 [Ascobolus immersus RN42]|uniref:Uncharacterized protein n=1 Tax=Ascobolus immersus RN42 TaxID=1160509 RepID=A0A3N4HSE6_ASCIM|nr:hypothetical protein BJ508DRAFT_181247 [Ascobolus immersus RN42]